MTTPVKSAQQFGSQTDQVWRQIKPGRSYQTHFSFWHFSSWKIAFFCALPYLLVLCRTFILQVSLLLYTSTTHRQDKLTFTTQRDLIPVSSLEALGIVLPDQVETSITTCDLICLRQETVGVVLSQSHGQEPSNLRKSPLQEIWECKEACKNAVTYAVGLFLVHNRHLWNSLI